MLKSKREGEKGFNKNNLLPDVKKNKINKVGVTTFSCLYQSCIFFSYA